MFENVEGQTDAEDGCQTEPESLVTGILLAHP